MPLHALLRSWASDCVWRHRLQIAKLLINYGADVSAINKKGKVFGDSHVGVRPKGPPNIGETPLEIALSNGYEEVASLLQKHGAKK